MKRILMWGVALLLNGCRWLSHEHGSAIQSENTAESFLLPVTHQTTLKGVPQDSKTIPAAASILDPNQKCDLAVGDALRVHRKLSNQTSGHYYIESLEVVRAGQVGAALPQSGQIEAGQNTGNTLPESSAPGASNPSTGTNPSGSGKPTVNPFENRDPPALSSTGSPVGLSLDGSNVQNTDALLSPAAADDAAQAEKASQNAKNTSQTSAQNDAKADSNCALTAGWIFAGHFDLSKAIDVAAGAIPEYDPEFGQKLALRMQNARNSYAQCNGGGYCYSCVYQALRPWWDISREGGLNACTYARSFADYWVQEKHGAMLHLKRTFTAETGSRKEEGLEAANNAPVGSVLVWDVCVSQGYCGNKRGVGHIAIVVSPGVACSQFCAAIKDTCRSRSDSQIIGVFQPYK